MCIRISLTKSEMRKSRTAGCGQCGRLCYCGGETSSSEVGAKLSEGREDDEFAGTGDDRLVFELPGMLVGDVDGVQADLHGGVDVAARAVANHPAVGFHDFVFTHEFAVGFGAFFGNDFDELEKALQTGALDFSRLFGGFALGEENQAV